MLMRRLDKLHLDYPLAGSRMLRGLLCREEHEVNRKRIQRLMYLMDIEAQYPHKNTSKSQPVVFPHAPLNSPYYQSYLQVSGELLPVQTLGSTLLSVVLNSP